MKSLCIQVQPERAVDLDMGRLIAAFQAVAERADLVEAHDFDSGFDDGPYFNFVFHTQRAGELWQLIRNNLYQSPPFQSALAAASMAMCSSEEGWDDYALLCHWDSRLPVQSADDL